MLLQKGLICFCNGATLHCATPAEALKPEGLELQSSSQLHAQQYHSLEQGTPCIPLHK